MQESKPHGDPDNITWSPTIGKIALAISKAQKAMGALVAGHTAEIKAKPGSGKRDYKYSYANIADALEACLSSYNEQECAVIQAVTTVKNGINITTLIAHSSGEWMLVAPLFMPVSGNAQAVGTAVTYGRRYQLLPAVGLAAEDDDGASSSSGESSQGYQRQQHDHRASSRKVVNEPRQEPRCTGKAAYIAIANTKHRADYSRVSGNPPESVWRGVLSRVGVPPTDDGGAPEPGQLTVKHGLAVRDLLKAGIAEIEAGDDQRQPGEDADDQSAAGAP